MVKPIKPNEVVSIKLDNIPDELIEAINELIVKKWDGYSAVVLQEDIEKLFLKKYPNVKEAKKKMYEEHWMDFEDIFRKEGWSVKFDKPGYDESYDAYFEFKPKKNKEGFEAKD
jgi:hypothetical protein